MKNKNSENKMRADLMVLKIAVLFVLMGICFVGFVSAEGEDEKPTVEKINKLADGTNIIEFSDGTRITELPDGTNITKLPDGTNITKLPGGTNITNLPDGTNITDLPDGTRVTTLPDGTKVLKLPGGGLWNRLIEGVFSIIYGAVIFGILISLIFFGIGFKTKNNLFYIAGAGTLLITAALYFSYPSVETPEIPAISAGPTQLGLETLLPLQQIDLLLASADKNKDSGDIAAEKLNLMNARDISLKNNLSEKTEIIETKLSDTTRREATEHRRSGNYENAIESIDESIEHSPDNPWAYVEGIINSEELENHDGAVDYAEELDEIEPAAETINDFPLDTKTADEYKNYAVSLNNDGTATAGKAETLENIGDAITAVKTGAEYLGEALIISETLGLTDVERVPTETVISNLGSININLIVLATQAGDSELGEDAINEMVKLIAGTPEVFSDDAVAIYKISAGTFKAVVDNNYNAGVEFGKEALDIANSAGANNLVGSCLAIQGGEENVKAAQPYLKAAADIDPKNEIYQRNLEVVNNAIANKVYEGIDINFGIKISEVPAEPEPLEPEPLEPIPTDEDLDGDTLNDAYEIKWELDPNNPDENDNGILDGYDDFDKDLFLTKSEMLIDSNPFDPKDPNLDDMIEVKAGSEIVDLPEGKDVYCYVKCCCIVNLEYGGVCTKWGSSVPPQTPGPYGYGWAPVGYGNYSYTGPGGCTSCDGSVSGSYHRYGGNLEDGEYTCRDTLKWEKEFKGVNEECEKPEEEFCKEKFGAECDKNKIKADAVAGDAVKKCIEDAKNACDGKLTVNNRCSSEVRSGSC